jgi:F0F1-type ATP synthase membrane subunit b/b'
VSARQRPARTPEDDTAAVDDVTRVLDQLVALVEGARAMPMSASCVVNRGEVLGLLDDLRRLLPAEFRQAEYVIRDREEVIEEGRREAERIRAAAADERERMLAETDVVREAQGIRERMLQEAAAQAEQMRREVDDYVDAKLANFEVVLTRTLATVERGREKLRERAGERTGARAVDGADAGAEPPPD